MSSRSKRSVNKSGSLSRFPQFREEGRGRSCPPSSKFSGPKKLTKWSYYHDGDVEIPEICVYSIDNRCTFEDQGCKRLHAKCTSQWQVLHRSVWCNFRNFHSIEIEEAFQDPSAESIQLTPVNPTKLGSAGRDMFKILGNDIWEVDFKIMMMKTKYSHTNQLSIRRLSTQSSAVSNSAKATTYAWYFLDVNSKWIEYGKSDSSQSNAYVSSMTSEEIEKHYNLNKPSSCSFSTSNFSYILDIESMQQINQTTGKARPVRRRPIKKQSSKANRKISNKANKELPQFWDPMKSTDTFVMITLDNASNEFKETEKLLLLTLPNKRAHVIKRVQNPFRWKSFQTKQDELSLRPGGVAKLNIQRLFHGTREEYIDSICKENFDWRLHGTHVGHKYGKGSYFTNSAAYASSFCTPNASGHCFILIAEVIVGEIANGSKNMSRPPKNQATEELYDTTVDNVAMPKIFVKYDKQEYYPVYVIEYI